MSGQNSDKLKEEFETSAELWENGELGQDETYVAVGVPETLTEVTKLMFLSALENEINKEPETLNQFFKAIHLEAPSPKAKVSYLLNMMKEETFSLNSDFFSKEDK